MFDFGEMTEIYEQANPVSGCVQIVLNLRPVLVGQLRHCFELNDDFIETDEIRDIVYAAAVALCR